MNSGEILMLDKLSQIEKRYQEIEKLMADPEVAVDLPRLIPLGKEHASLEHLVKSYHEYQETLHALDGAREIADGDEDPDLLDLAKEEMAQLEEKRAVLEAELKEALLPKDAADTRDVFIEIRGATGGEEAALFAAELYRMYARYAQTRGWEVEMMDAHESGVGGLKEVVFEVRGKDVYSRLKHESGGHRVQRVPSTESSGRLHTSTATVAVLPEADEVELDVKDEDLRIDIFHSGGAGGQNVNKVATAVRITHLPTGVMAVCQDERSQLRNKQKAMAVLKARLLDRATREHDESISQQRRSQVGTGVRAEKIRTYNFPQDRVTDHRLDASFHNIPGIMGGALDPILEPLIAQERSRGLEA